MAENTFKKLDYWLHREHSVAWCKLRYAQALWRNGFKKKTVLFYPEKPKNYHILYSVCHILGYKITNDPKEKFDLAIAFQDITVRPSDPVLDDLSKRYPVVNANCIDISKKRVEKMFEDVFGYGMAIDPRTYAGSYVRKSDTNAIKDATIFSGPSTPEKGYVYQKLINSLRDEKTAFDMRVVIFKDVIPVVMVRYRSIPDRFIDDTVKAELVDVNTMLNSDEQKKIIEFAKKFGLDYGEFDILRDKGDGKIYIVDVNNTPGGPVPGVHISTESYDTILDRSAEAFVEKFMPK